MLLAILLAIIPQPSAADAPAVESIELNYMVRPIIAPDEWWVRGWEPAVSQAIIRGVHPRTNSVEIMGWSGGGMQMFRCEKVGKWHYLRTSAGIVKSQALFESFTDFDPERDEAYNRLPIERREGWPK